MMKRHVLPVICLIVFTGCTTIGLPDHERVKQMDFGEKETLRLCVLKDRDVTQKRVDSVISALEFEFNQYSIEISVPWIKEWSRPGFWSSTIMEDHYYKAVANTM